MIFFIPENHTTFTTFPAHFLVRQASHVVKILIPVSFLQRSQQLMASPTVKQSGLHTIKPKNGQPPPLQKRAVRSFSSI